VRNLSDHRLLAFVENKWAEMPLLCRSNARIMVAQSLILETRIESSATAWWRRKNADISIDREI